MGVVALRPAARSMCSTAGPQTPSREIRSNLTWDVHVCAPMLWPDRVQRRRRLFGCPWGRWRVETWRDIGSVRVCVFVLFDWASTILPSTTGRQHCPARLGVDKPSRLVTPCLQEPQTSPLSDTPPSASPPIPSRLFECGGSQHLRHTHRPGSSSAALTFSGIGEPPGPCKSSLSNTRCTLHPTPSLPPSR